MGRSVDSNPRVLAQRYAIEHELGRGGMGTVFLARDLKHDRPVAVKFLGSGTVPTAADAARFLAEIRTTAKLQHPHILTVHDSGEADGQLYYVMPCIEGESLRDRIQRERRLPVGEAVRIARAVADALAYAHTHGVVHRDVKPENVLLDRHGHAWVADFGLARALSTVTSTRLTSPGLTVGSPAYMSPEQIEGADQVDGRSDLYALGCILFEMLTGRPPYEGRAGDVMRRHLTETPPSARARRADVSPELDALIARLLAKDPAQRPAAANDVVRALALVARSSDSRTALEPIPGAVNRPGWLRRSVVISAVGLIAAIAFAAWLALPNIGATPAFGAATDSTRYAILPLRSDAELSSTPHHLLLHEAIARWQDISAVEPMRTADVVSRHFGTGPLSLEEAAEAARRLGAGRFLHGSEMQIGDSTQITVALYESKDDAPQLRSASLKVARGGLAPAGTYVALVDSLLFGRTAIVSVGNDQIGTRSARALDAYGRAHAALETWDLSAADSLLEQATELDRSFVRARLWLAQVRRWRDLPVEYWNADADFAASAGERLTERERLLSRGLSALGQEQFPEACAAFAEMARLDPRDFAGWHGLGDCHRLDRIVLPDPASPSGWRFRGSYHAAVEAYRHAYRILPSSHLLTRDGGLAALQARLFTVPLGFRNGRRETADVAEFLAHPSLVDDTLAFVPHTFDEWTGTQDVAAWHLAIARQRRVFADIVQRWVANYPRSADAAYARSVALDMLGDPESVEWVRRARSLETPGSGSYRIAASHVWLELRYGAPDTMMIARARALADSLLTTAPLEDTAVARVLAPIAAVFGRPSLAGRLHALRPDADIPAAASRPANALIAFASLGAPVDSIRLYEQRTLEAIRHAVPASQHERARGYLLELPAQLAFPAVILDAMRSGTMRTEAGRAQSAWLHAHPARDSLLAAFTTPPERPAESTPEAMYATARLLALAGDTTAAIAWLDSMLGALRWFPQDVFGRIGDAGVIGRAMALRARLAEARGDVETTRRWGPAAHALWAHGEPHFRALSLRLAPP